MTTWKLLDQLDAAEDREAAQHERQHDAPEQQPRAVLRSGTPK